LGRASGLQVKMIKEISLGHTATNCTPGNEIYISEEGRWINVDSTFGSTLGRNFFDNSDFFQGSSET